MCIRDSTDTHTHTHTHTRSLTNSLTHAEKKTLRDHYKYNRATDALISTVTYTAKFQHIYVKSYVYV